MWYKQNNEEWLTGNKIEFPDGTTFKDNHEDTKDGWQWHDEAPQEYLLWLEEQGYNVTIEL